MIIHRITVLLFLVLCSGVVCLAEPENNDKKKNNGKKPDPPKDELFETTHRIMLGDEEIEYRATTGTIVLKKEEGEPRASVFFIAYEKISDDDGDDRPVTFSFNGGPGSSSVWLHLGVLGPRRIQMPDDGTAPPPPYQLVDNAYTLLDVSDLVFIDPVSTGFSRAAPGYDASKFHGVEADLNSVGEFIRLYTTRNHRWQSPKFLIGESYGTIRAAGLAMRLQDAYGMYLNGIMLVSTVLDFQTINFAHGNDLPYSLFLPAFAATARYHHRLPAQGDRPLPDFLAEVEAFALGDYNVALAQGDALPQEQRKRIAQRLADYTGLPEDYIEKSDLRVNIFKFARELLREDRKIIGRFDSRITGVVTDPIGSGYEYDPSYTAIHGPISTMLNHYLRTELNFESDLTYEILSGKVHPWNYGKYKNRYLHVADRLHRAMVRNPYLKVFIGAGYYDLATPFSVTNYTVNHLGLAPDLRDNISVSYYEAGHMMYTHKPSLIKMKSDLAAFIRAAAPH